MEKDTIPCCVSDALWRIRQGTINEHPTGLTMLDQNVRDVEVMSLLPDAEIQSARMKRVKVYNYIPASVESVYARVILEQYRIVSLKTRGKNGCQNGKD